MNRSLSMLAGSMTAEPTASVLPSQFQIGDHINFNGRVVVTGVEFEAGAVHYTLGLEGEEMVLAIRAPSRSLIPGWLPAPGSNTK